MISTNSKPNGSIDSNSFSQVAPTFKALTVAMQHLKQNVAVFSQNVSLLSNEYQYGHQSMNYRTHSENFGGMSGMGNISSMNDLGGLMNPNASSMQNRINPIPIDNQILDIETKIQLLESRIPIEIMDLTEKRQYQLKIKNIVDELSDMKEEFRMSKLKHERYIREREILLDGELRESDPLQKHRHLIGQNMSLDRSINVLEQVKDTGRSMLGMLSEQSESIRHARERLIDMGVSLGISQSVLRSIDRRMKMDTVIVCCGMFIVIMLLIFIWFYVM